MRGTKNAQAAIKYLSGLKVPEGRLAGKKMRLANYQKDFVRGAYAKGTVAACLSIGRGNAKTALASGLALAHLSGAVDPQPRREILFAARNRDQATTALDFLIGFIAGLPEDEQKEYTIRRGSKLEVETKMNGGGIARVIPADGKSILGGAPTLAILDERASWEPEKGDALEAGILSGLGKRDGRVLLISTSAPDDANTFSRWLDEPPPNTFTQEHRPQPGLPPDDVESLLIANPGSSEGIGPTKEWLIGEAQRAMSRGGHALSAFRNLNRNERTAADNRSVLLSTDEWLGCEVPDDELPARFGPVIVGVDLGGSRSMSACSMYWPETSRLESIGAFPTAPTLADRGQGDGVKDRYELMAQRGELLTFGETVVDVSVFLAQVAGMLSGHSITALVCDRFRSAEFEEAARAAGLGTVPIIYRGQGWKDGSEDCERLRRAVFEGRVKTSQSLLLRSAFADAITLVDPAGNHKIAKGRSKGRIDAACSTVLAVSEGARVLTRPVPKVRLAWG